MPTLMAYVERIDLLACNGWRMDEWSLHHETGRYFSVIAGHDGRQEHILIDQPEIGILGFLFFGEGADRRWLLQHKAEPGNLPYEQWAPSVQATASNYQRIHGGRPTVFLDWFTGANPLRHDVLGSEQGGRFLNKFNRNVKRSVPLEFGAGELPSHYAWVSSAWMRAKLREDFAVNTDARSVLASGAWGLLADAAEQIFLNGQLPSTLADAFHRSFLDSSPERAARGKALLRNIHQLQALPFNRLSFAALSAHEVSPSGIHTLCGEQVLGYFDCALPNREVPRWQQPLLERGETAEHVLLFRVEGGLAWFLVTALPEPGFADRTEFGPSLQSGHTPGKQSSEAIRATMEQDDFSVICAIQQTDEGGRFYRNLGRFMLAEWAGDPAAVEGGSSTWLTLGDLESFSGQRSRLTNELRTLLSLVLSYA